MPGRQLAVIEPAAHRRRQATAGASCWRHGCGSCRRLRRGSPGCGRTRPSAGCRPRPPRAPTNPRAADSRPARFRAPRNPSSGRTMTGTSCIPTRCAARHRRSPAISSKAASSTGERAHQQRLQDALFADRLGERVELGLGKAPPRLERRRDGSARSARGAAAPDRRTSRPRSRRTAPRGHGRADAASPARSCRAIARALRCGAAPRRPAGYRPARRRSRDRRSAPACRATAPRQMRTLRGIIVSKTLAPK